MNVLNKLSALTAILLLGACTSESERGLSDNPPSPSDGDGVIRREVLMTLKNKLQVQPVSKASGIATEAENSIRALDVYVFGSATEDGEYTFQERFAYREKSSDIPYGATALDLQAKGTEGTETTALLSLKKGLFVKLYCVANQPDLVNPAKAENNGKVEPGDFAPLELAAPGQAGATLQQAGVPKETTFLTFHTPLLDASVPGDTLVAPLPMTGAYTTPLDLTDFSVSARTQVGFKLTRMVARFDVTNNAIDSKFTIESFSMAKGRRGAIFFPVKVYDGADKLITYPLRKFYGEQANLGTQAGAFYTWPSPIEDKGYLILKGKYHVNQTETKEVTYQIPFRQEATDGSGSFLEITNNHRYTICITKADEYHLDFNLTVSDWTDEGDMDDYHPEEGVDDVDVTCSAGSGSSYNIDSKTVKLDLADGSYVNLTINTKASQTFSKKYQGGLENQQYDWLTVDVQTTKADEPDAYTCKLYLNKNYQGTFYPRATLRFQNMINGSEKYFFVNAVSAPQIVSVTKTGTDNYNQFDAGTSTISMYRTTLCDVLLKASGMEPVVIIAPDWLNVDKISDDNMGSTYKLTLKNADEVVQDDKAILYLKYADDDYLKKDLTLQLLSTEMTIDDQTFTAGNSVYTSIPVISPEGCTAELPGSWNGGGQWFTFSNNTAGKGTGSIAVLQGDNRNVLMKPVTVHLKNKISGGKDKDITFTPTSFAAPVLSAQSSSLDNVRNESTSLSFTLTPPAGGYVYSGITDGNIISVTQSGDKFTVTAKKKGSTKINFKNKSDESKIVSYTVTVNRDWKGQAVWKYNGYYIAPSDVATTNNWTSTLNSNCSGVSGAGSGQWFVPDANQWVTIIGASGLYPINSNGATFQSLKSNGVLTYGYYVSTSNIDNNNAYAVGVYADKMNVGSWQKAYTGLKIRCVSK